MIYSDLVTFLGSIFQIPVTNSASAAPYQSPEANTILPRIIDLAEQMIYTDMDFIATREIDTSTMFTSGSREMTLPAGAMVVEGVAQVSPAGKLPNQSGATVNQLEPVSLDVVDMFFPTPAANTGSGDYWAMKDATTIVVGPTPDADYVAAVTATFRPPAMSATNTITYIGTTYPQLLMTATAYYMAGYQRDFGAQSEDPKLASSWKGSYDYILPTCVMEEKRRKGENIQTSRSSSEAPAPNPQSKSSE